MSQQSGTWFRPWPWIRVPRIRLLSDLCSLVCTFIYASNWKLDFVHVIYPKTCPSTGPQSKYLSVSIVIRTRHESLCNHHSLRVMMQGGKKLVRRQSWDDDVRIVTTVLESSAYVNMVKFTVAYAAITWLLFHVASQIQREGSISESYEVGAL